MPTATTRPPISIEELQANTSDLVRKVAQDRDPLPVAIDNKPAVVLLDLETYHEYIHLINFSRTLLQAEAEIREGKTRPIDEFFKELLGEQDRAKKVSR